MRLLRLQGFSLLVATFLLAGSDARADELPADIAMIPGDAAGFIRIEVKEILSSSLFDDARIALAGLRPEEIAAFTKRFPVDPSTLERLLVIFPNAESAADPIPYPHPTAVSAVAVATFSKPFDRTKLLSSFFAAGRLKSYRGFTYQFDEESWSGVFALQGDRTVVIGAEDSIIALMDQIEKGSLGSGPLAPSRAASAGHTLFAAVNPATVIPPETQLPKNIMPLLHARCITFALDVRKSVKPELQFHFANAPQAEAGETAFRECVQLARGKIADAEKMMKSMIDAPGSRDPQLSAAEFPGRFAMFMGVGIFRQLDNVLSTLPIQRNDGVVKISTEWQLSTTGMSLVTGITAITALGSNAKQTFEYVGNSIKPGQAAGPSPEEQRLKKLHTALEAYRASHGNYPPISINGKDNVPLLSGRVALLPYLGEQKLYDQFRFNEPWDSLHNKKLIAKMPATLNRPHIYPKNYGKTNFEIMSGVGKATADAASDSILALESGGWDPVYWTKPSELSTTTSHTSDPIRKIQVNSSWAVFADGSVKFVDKKGIEKSLPAPVTNRR